MDYCLSIVLNIQLTYEDETMIETVLEYLLIYWALPSLVTMLLVISWMRHDNVPETPSSYGSSEWFALVLLSAFYPVGLLAVFCYTAWPWLIKERGK